MDTSKHYRKIIFILIRREEMHKLEKLVLVKRLQHYCGGKKFKYYLSALSCKGTATE